MPDKPAVTDDHLKKYQAIMDTPVASKTPVSATSTNQSATPKKADESTQKNPFASYVPKPTGLGNKMFIFTGKKKIIIDGSEREVEKVKTVNPKAEEKKIEVSVPHLPPSPPPTPNSKATTPPAPPQQTASTTAPLEKVKDNPLATPPKPSSSVTPGYSKNEKKTTEKVSSGGKKIPTVLVAIFAVIFIAAWTLFWLVFFGFIKF